MDKIDLLFTEEEVRARIKEVAKEISDKYKDENVVLIGILKGAVYFLTALSMDMATPNEITFMAASSYGAGTHSSGNVIVKIDIDREIAGEHVIIVEDIIDTGNTLKLLIEMLKHRKPASIETAVLLDKPSRRIADIEADYAGYKIPDKFVVGWGLDYNQKYRDLPYIGVIKE